MGEVRRLALQGRAQGVGSERRQAVVMGRDVGVPAVQVAGRRAAAGTVGGARARREAQRGVDEAVVELTAAGAFGVGAPRRTLAQASAAVRRSGVGRRGGGERAVETLRRPGPGVGG